MNQAKFYPFVHAFMAGMASVSGVVPIPSEFPRLPENGIQANFSPVGDYFWHAIEDQDDISVIVEDDEVPNHVGQQLDLLDS